MYKAINGYECIYEVNELGKIRSIDRELKSKNGSIRKYKGKELNPAMTNQGYFIVQLNKNGIYKTHSVHRLVAEAFLPNPDNLPQIHHINHERKDNRACNLQWVSKAEQRDEHWTKAQSKAKGIRLRVVGHGIDKIYNSAHEVERELGVDRNCARKVARGIYKKSKGYKIYFADQETNNA